MNLTKEEYLSRVAHSVETLGYIKASNTSDMPTWEIALNMDRTTPETHKLAESALEWVSGITPKNDYESRLKTACLKEELDLMNLPLVASLIPAYTRNVSFKRKIDEDNKVLCESSNFIGNQDETVEVDVVRTKAARFSGFGGDTCIYQFIDKDNNVFAWKTNTTKDLFESCKKIKGDIKGHQVWNGIKETILKNVEVID